MAAVYKINDDFYNDSFRLIALHTTLVDYALVYDLNQCLHLRLKRTKKDFDLSENKSFSCFDWDDENQDMYWVLLANRSSKNEVLSNNDLFQNEATFSTPRLLPEYKEVDYVLKIESERTFNVDELIKRISTLPKVMAVYEIQTDKLKSKNNLKF